MNDVATAGALTEPDGGSASTAVVTGGFGGIGAAITTALIDAGYRVAVIDVAAPPEPAPAEVSCYAGSVTDAEFVRDSLDDFLGSPDAGLSVLVNCAGLIQRAAFGTASLADTVRLIEVNVIGVMTVTHLALPRLRKAAAAAIINIGSIWATNVWPERSVYSASKAAVEHFTRCLEADLSDSPVRAYCVSPGLVRTPLTDTVTTDNSFVQRFSSRLGASRFLDPVEISAVIVSVLRGELSYASGAPIFLHGGFG